MRKDDPSPTRSKNDTRRDLGNIANRRENYLHIRRKLVGNLFQEIRNLLQKFRRDRYRSPPGLRHCEIIDQ
jgi:hypothetical protein